MPDKLELRVFLASPAGLSIERDLVEDVASTLNASISDHLDANISVRRYEQLTAQPGRPQDKINEWVDSCDVLIAIVHRRWGSPAGSEYETGFQEEFERAFDRYRRTGSPFVALYFKAVDAPSLQDPGPQLARVMDFRGEIEKNHRVLYQTFDSPEQFKSLILHLLVEQLHTRRKAIDTSRGHTPGRSSAQVEIEVGQDTTAPSAPLVSTLKAFASLASGDDPAVDADADRLLLFALSASRDNEHIPVHLANRLASGPEIEDLRTIEWRSWIRSYLADVGRSADHAGRVFPLGEIARRPAAAEQIASRAAELHADDDRDVRVGAARVSLALNTRSDLLWSRKLDDRSGVIARWSRLALDDVRLAVDLWCGQSKTSDGYLLRALSKGDSDIAARVAASILAAAAPDGTTDELLLLNRDLIVSQHLRAYLDADVADKASSETLGTMATNRYASDVVREVAFQELATRRDLPQSLVEVLIDDTEESSTSTPPALAELELAVLRNVADPLLAAAIDAVVAKRKRSVLYIPGRWRLARVTLSDSVRPAFERLLRLAAVPEEAIPFAAHAGNAKYLSDAMTWLADDSAVLSHYADQLRSSGTAERVISVLIESIQFNAAQYLLTLGASVVDQTVQDAVQQLAASATIGRDAWARLVDEMCPSPETRILAVGPYESDRRKYLVSRTRTRELKKLLVQESESVVDAAIVELRRREATPARAVLLRLLRSGTDSTRLTAARLLYENADASQLIAAREKYVSDRYFYNVVAFLDARLIGLSDNG
ncbi:DUF4062 domain-containing protein [Microbacterium sp. NPDC056044]|uniref:DUF4062 domain-containing protein n=1 Tax=Microbacterium sp. NPDC056044 TaxID=3345690 RepID=UPI0035D92DAE